MSRGRWRLIDLLAPDVIRRLVKDGVLPAAAAQEAHAKLFEAEALISKAGSGEHLTRLDITTLMADYPGRPPRGTRVRKERRYRQYTDLPIGDRPEPGGEGERAPED